MTAIEFQNISKQYRLGQISTGTISHDLNRWWSRVRGKDDPYLTIGEVNDRAHKGGSEYVWALRNIGFKVEQGDVVGIIGKNGAGKSTLLKILSKITAPTTGMIRARGRIAALLEVGTGFHPEMTGRENIFMNGAIMGMTRAEISRKLDEIVDFAGVERYLDTPVKRYSSGMMVRLGFAVAAHLEPEILIVDEVLAVGDAEFQKKAIGKMQEVSKGEGRTVLFVSHNMGAVKNLCKSGIVLENGEIAFSGNIQEVLIFYQNQLQNIEEGLDRIVQLGKSFSKKIDVYDIKINGSESLDHDLFGQNGYELEIKVTGCVNVKTRIELEGRLFDDLGVPLAMFSTGHNRRFHDTYEQGDFIVKSKICLPSAIHKGQYLLSIDVSNPGVEYFFRVKGLIKLNIPGFITPHGNVFEYRNGNGFIHLFEKSER